VIATRSISLAALLLLVGTTASAQQPRTVPPAQPAERQEGARTPAQRLHFEIDGIYHAATQTMSDSASPTVYAETAALTADYGVPAGAGFSGSASFRFWKNLGIGMSVSSFSTSFTADVTGSIPNPFAFNRPRTFEGSVDDIERKELAIGINLRGFFQLTPKFAVSVFAGPTRISLTQDVVTSIQYTESYPYDTATFSAAQIATDKLDKVVFGGGADLAFYFTKAIGIGLGVKYHGGETEIVSLSGTSMTTKIGGAEFGGGLRLRF
jgi:hypothetical protein